ncbi:SIS domain-containing protein [Nocardia sp. NPDC050175]|uniref:SIS domain-containing protein n=1 Tax=Nocardia sp. NPDC050175 TaxID=3364317 RepID=UPI0037B2CE9E
MTAFDKHIAEQPDVINALLEAELPVLDPDRPLIFTGVGSSMHACRIAEAWVRCLGRGPAPATAIEAHDLALTGKISPDHQIVVVSHRGTKRYPNRVLRLAADVGATTIAVTGQGPTEPGADVVVRTCPQEQSGTHTVSYTAALTILARLAAGYVGHRGQPLVEALTQVPGALRQSLELPISGAAVETLAAATTPAIIAGTGTDAITAAEAALKIKEGTYRWAEGLHTEFALHGTPAVYTSATTGFLLRPMGPDGGRTRDLETLLRTIGAPVFHCGDDEGADLPVAAVPALARPLVAIVPFQRLVSLVATRTGASPDHIHTDIEPWKSAMTQVEL